MSAVHEMPAHTFHCLCTTLILVSVRELDALQRRTERALDKAYVIRVADEKAQSRLLNVTQDEEVVVEVANGFERRRLIKCTKCKLIVGYKLDQTHYPDSSIDAENIAYLLPGGLMSTEDMQAGKIPENPAWAKQETDLNLRH